MKFEWFFKICGFLTPITAYTLIFISIMNAPWFSWRINALSDLGVVFPSSIYFNFGLIFSGFLELIYSIGLIFQFRGLLHRLSIFTLIFDSISLMGIGFFPETAGKIHFYFSVAFFAFYPLSLLIFFLGSLVDKCHFKLGLLGLILAFTSIGIWIFPWKIFGVKGVAIPEFLSSLCGSLWIFTSSIIIFKRNINPGKLKII
ncbi:MAG: DUF998 domain-containing protein [archaeon GB-1845-036]|nr:DUF998 domain-containing protein [Candidatus Culexmicrobium thermophilum]